MFRPLPGSRHFKFKTLCHFDRALPIHVIEPSPAGGGAGRRHRPRLNGSAARYARSLQHDNDIVIVASHERFRIRIRHWFR
jgi:hypothetical protein